jgi:hypothetical protein
VAPSRIKLVKVMLLAVARLTTEACTAQDIAKTTNWVQT